MFCSILFAHVLGISEFMFRKDISLLLFFPFNTLPAFSMRVMLTQKMNWKELLPLLTLERYCIELVLIIS